MLSYIKLYNHLYFVKYVCLSCNYKLTKKYLTSLISTIILKGTFIPYITLNKKYHSFTRMTIFQ